MFFEEKVPEYRLAPTGDRLSIGESMATRVP
jgi:hypothetical protein